MKRILVSAVTLCILMIFTTCNKKCGGMENSEEGNIIEKFDFADCFLYARVDSTLVISSDSAFTAYKNKNFKNCNSSTFKTIDFNQHSLLGYMVRIPACNVAFHRKVEIDNVAKVYRYTVTIEKCTGCNQQISSPNFVLVPKIPSNYGVVFETK